MVNKYVVEYIIKHFPNTATEKIAKELNLSTHQVRTIAKRHNVVKCKM